MTWLFGSPKKIEPPFGERPAPAVAKKEPLFPTEKDDQYPETSWARCTNDEYGFSFFYPRGWIQVHGSNAMVLRAYDADSFYCDGVQVFSPCVTLMVSERGNTEGQAPDEVFAEFKDLLPRFFPGAQITLQPSFALTSGQKGNQISFDFPKGGRMMTSVLAHVVTPSNVFTFDGCCLKTAFSTWEASLRKSIRSLSVT